MVTIPANCSHADAIERVQAGDLPGPPAGAALGERTEKLGNRDSDRDHCEHEPGDLKTTPSSVQALRRLSQLSHAPEHEHREEGVAGMQRHVLLIEPPHYRFTRKCIKLGVRVHADRFERNRNVWAHSAGSSSACTGIT